MGRGCVGSRVALTFGGLVAIGLATGSAYGLCSMFGLFYSPLMNVLPFLLLGVGVDDMFVIVNAYDLVTTREGHLDLPTRVGKTLSSAGAEHHRHVHDGHLRVRRRKQHVPPGAAQLLLLRALGILFIFFFQVTWFVACLTLDEWRRGANRRDCACCVAVAERRARAAPRARRARTGARAWGDGSATRSAAR